MFVRTLTTLVASAALLTACATREVDYQGEGEGFIGAGTDVTARLETPSVGTAGQDAADDPAIWAGSAPIMIGGVATRGFVAGTVVGNPVFCIIIGFTSDRIRSSKFGRHRLMAIGVVVFSIRFRTFEQLQVSKH